MKPKNTIFTQGHLPQVPMYFFGGPMEDRTMQAVRDTIFEGKGIDILGGIYEVQWNNLRWEAHFVEDGTLRTDGIGKVTVFRGDESARGQHDDLQFVFGSVQKDPLVDRVHDVGNPNDQSKITQITVEKNGLVKP